MRLSQLFPDVPADFDQEVTGVTADSRLVTPGFIFAALMGQKSDGADFIPAAMAAGAIAVITDRTCSEEGSSKDCLILPVKAPRRELARIASLLYPGQPPFIVGVTGTNGKTSVVHFARQLWQALGCVSGSLGTLGAVAAPIISADQDIGDADFMISGLASSALASSGLAGSGRAGSGLGDTGSPESKPGDAETLDKRPADASGPPPRALYMRALSHTTPEPVELHSILCEMRKCGVTHLAMEVSSHGLDQYRADYVNFSAAAFTNLTRDHLDYHKTAEDYGAAKARLFTTLLPETGIALINGNGAGADKFLSIALNAGTEVKSIGTKGCLIEMSACHPTSTGLELSLRCKGQIYHIALPLIGRFQAENALLAAAIVIESGYEVATVLPLLEFLQGVPGRMALVGQVNFETGPPASILVDYAHTPDAIRSALAACRPHLERQGRLHIVFGAGGDRDIAKRPMMGKAAYEGADFCIITDDNPRTEEPVAIRDAIKSTCPDAPDIGDRAEAIKTAIGRLQSGDILLIAGKGHETGQITAGGTLPFSDREEVRKALAARQDSAAR